MNHIISIVILLTENIFQSIIGHQTARMTVDEKQNSFEDDEYYEDMEEAEEVIEDFNDEIKTESLSGERTLPEGWIIKGKGR